MDRRGLWFDSLLVILVTGTCIWLGYACAQEAAADTIPVAWTHPNPDSVTHYVLALGTERHGDDLGVYRIDAPEAGDDGVFRESIETPPLPAVVIYRAMVAGNAVHESVPSNVIEYRGHVPIPEPPVLLENGFGLLTLFVLRGRGRA